MADWYVSSAAWTALPQFAASHTYAVGNIIRPLTAPAFNAQFAFRCSSITTGISASTEPSWAGAANNNSTVTSGGATFTNVTGQSTYGWTAPAGNIYCLSSNSSGGSRFAIGDRAFLSSDHSESTTGSTYTLYGGGAAFGVVEAISVNRAGSVPPVAADVLSGAAITITTGNFILDCATNEYWQGVTFTLGGTAASLSLANASSKMHYFKNCAIVFSTSATTAPIINANMTRVVFDNTTVQFNAAGQRFAFAQNSQPADMIWINTPSATLGTVPTVLFSAASGSGSSVLTCRGVDLSAVTTTLCYGAGSATFTKALFDSCRIASGVVRLGTGVYSNTADEIELVNCYDGSNFLAERHTPAGDVTTEFTITLSGGAADTAGAFSHKMVSSTRSDKFAMPLESFWMDVNNLTIGGSRTATVEIISSASLNNDEIVLLLEYEGTVGSSLASFTSSFPNPLTTPSAVTSSSAAWNSSPATPVTQKLQVTFTPQVVGRVRGQVRLGKASTTVYVDPRLVLT